MYHKLEDALKNAKRGDKIAFRRVHELGTIMDYGITGEFVRYDQTAAPSISVTVKIKGVERKTNPRFIDAVYDALTNEKIYLHHPECAM